MALDTPAVPFANPFVLRNWDIRENLPQTLLGTDQATNILYFGRKPTGPPGTVHGSADQWGSGLSYATWQAGGYGAAGTACECGVWSSLCQTILPPTLNVTGTFPELSFPFSVVARWQRLFFPGLGVLNVWRTDPLAYVCNGVNRTAFVLLIENVPGGGWVLEGFNSVGVQVDIQPVAQANCAYPQTWTGAVSVAGIADRCDFGVGQERPFVFLTFAAP